MISDDIRSARNLSCNWHFMLIAFNPFDLDIICLTNEKQLNPATFVLGGWTLEYLFVTMSFVLPPWPTLAHERT